MSMKAELTTIGHGPASATHSKNDAWSVALLCCGESSSRAEPLSVWMPFRSQK
jgi:hypothetical protein